jgi:dual oxidase maturation factor 1
VGVSISIIDLLYPHSFSTILEMDYGTPFDRHIIIEDSHETKAKKKSAAKLEEPSSAAGGFGGLFRRLSKRDRERAAREAAGLPVSASDHPRVCVL